MLKMSPSASPVNHPYVQYNCKHVSQVKIALKTVDKVYMYNTQSILNNAHSMATRWSQATCTCTTWISCMQSCHNESFILSQHDKSINTCTAGDKNCGADKGIRLGCCYLTYCIILPLQCTATARQCTAAWGRVQSPSCPHAGSRVAQSGWGCNTVETLAPLR